MRILVMGGTRFIGVYLTKLLASQGHTVVLFNRGNNPPPIEGIEQLRGDRTNADQLQAALAGQTFDAIFDNNGRKLGDAQPLIDRFKGKLSHYVYVSSAGVYLKSDEMPHVEGDALDPASRHRGKFETENYLAEQSIPFTSVRPVYIYGPQNYNPVESWFFDRIVRDRPIPIPGNGLHITQLGHVEDLARAMAAVLGNADAVGKIYNIAGDRYVTFDGLARACAIAAGKSADDLKLVHYNPKDFDFGKRKAFPLRLQHFFTDIHSAQQDLNWSPKYDLVSGLRDSYENDFLPSRQASAEVDFSLDDQILQAAN